MGALISGGQLARRDEGAWPQRPVTEEQRSQAAFSAKTLRAAALLPAACVGSALTARCGDARPSPPWPQPKSPAAAPFLILKQALSRRTTKSTSIVISDPISAPASRTGHAAMHIPVGDGRAEMVKAML